MPAHLETKTVVVGGGPAGYVCAIRLGQLGVPVVLVEKEALGGTCLNVGCIPSKALISASELYERIGEADLLGIHAEGLRVDLSRMMAWKAGIVSKLTGGVRTLVEGAGGKILLGAARFAGPHELEVAGGKGRTTIRFESAVLATGSVPATVPGFDLDGERIVSSTEALAWTEAPKSLVVVGGGYIGMELGQVWQRLGSKVTVVEFLDRILPGFEKDLARPVEKRFTSSGGRVLAKTKATRWEKRKGGGLRVHVEARDGGKAEVLDADRVLVTVGRRPFTEGLGLEALGVALDARGFVTVDGAQRSSVQHVYAVGDVAGEPMLAHKGMKEGEVAAEVIAGLPSVFDSRAIPAVVFTDPEIATVGLTESEAKARGLEVRTGRFAFAANGRALSLGRADGFVRVVADRANDVLLGAQVVGPEASSLVAELALAVETGALVEDVASTIHAHPTLPEAILEAAHALHGRSLHGANR